jgi:hypothetical protein
MKKYLTILSVTLLLTNTLTSYCQITIKKEIIDKPILKPLPFDSSHNISTQKRAIDYYQYVGQKIYFLPLSQKYKFKDSRSDEGLPKIDYIKTTKSSIIKKTGFKPFDSSLTGLSLYSTYGERIQTDKRVHDEYMREKKRYEERESITTDIYSPVFYAEHVSSYDVTGYVSTNIDSIAGKYFTILDIQGSSSSWESFMDLKEFSSESYCRGLKIKLRKDDNQDTLFWMVRDAELISTFPFLLVPYYSQPKRLYESKSVVAGKDVEDLVEINTGNQVNISQGEVLKCTEVTLVGFSKQKHMTPSFILKNKNNEEIALPFNVFFESEFITKEQLDEILRVQKLQEVEREKERRISIQRQKQESAKHLADCINKYGQELGQLIYEGKVSLGMNAQMCLSAWGQPLEIYRTTVNGLSHEQWQYSWKHYLYFDNGLLTAIQN